MGEAAGMGIVAGGGAAGSIDCIFHLQENSKRAPNVLNFAERHAAWLHREAPTQTRVGVTLV